MTCKPAVNAERNDAEFRLRNILKPNSACIGSAPSQDVTRSVNQVSPHVHWVLPNSRI
jgi:hypothetical protein